MLYLLISNPNNSIMSVPHASWMRVAGLLGASGVILGAIGNSYNYINNYININYYEIQNIDFIKVRCISILAMYNVLSYLAIHIKSRYIIIYNLYLFIELSIF